MEPLLEVADVMGASTQITLHAVTTGGAASMASKIVEGWSSTQPPALPGTFSSSIEDARAEFGAVLHSRARERWFDAVERRDVSGSLRPLRDGTVEPNAILRDFGVAWMNVLLWWPDRSVAAVLPDLMTLGSDPDALDSAGQGAPHAVLKRSFVNRSRDAPAATEGLVEILAAILACGARPRADAKGRSPLHFLMLTRLPEADWLACLRALVSAGADCNGVDEESGWAPLHTLASSPWARPSVAALLIELGADPAMRDHEGRTPFDLAQVREHRRDDAPLSSLLIAGKPAGPSFEPLAGLMREEARRWAPPNDGLVAAIHARDLRELQMLLADGVDPDARWSREPSPLWYARRRGFDEIVDALVDAGASRDEGGRSFGWIAEAEDYRQSVRQAQAAQITAFGPIGASDELVDEVDRETAREIRARPSLASRHVAGRRLAVVSADFGLARTMEELCALAPGELEHEPWSLLERAASRMSLETFEVLLRHGLDPFHRGNGLSPFIHIAREGRIDALVACVKSCRDPKALAKDLRLALQTMIFGRGRKHYVAGFLRESLLALRGQIDGASIEPRKRSKNLAADAWGAGQYFAEVNRVPPGWTPDVVAVRAPLDAVISARARGRRDVLHSAHERGIPWVPRAEIVFRIGTAAWTLVVAFGPSPEGTVGIASMLADALATTAVGVLVAGAVVCHPSGSSADCTVAELETFCRAEQLLLPALEIGIDLGIVSLIVRGMVAGAVSDASVIVVTPDQYRERASSSEQAAIEHARALGAAGSRPRSRRR